MPKELDIKIDIQEEEWEDDNNIDEHIYDDTTDSEKGEEIERMIETTESREIRRKTLIITHTIFVVRGDISPIS